MANSMAKVYETATVAKNVTQLRNYSEDFVKERVKFVYYSMHVNQTVDSVKQKHAQWTMFNHASMTMMDAIECLDHLVDESDPDLEVPNSVHAFQTAESIRKAHPDKPWFQVTGLIHDVGKILAKFGEPWWHVAPDTYPVGCAFSEKIEFGPKSFAGNADLENPKYNTKLGMYTANCGLDNVIMSWGHDEYMYQVLKNSSACRLPEKALYMIRHHSFYPWHTFGEYGHLCNDADRAMLPWVLELNKHDNYSKVDTVPEMDQLKPYYRDLIEEFVPGELKW